MSQRLAAAFADVCAFDDLPNGGRVVFALAGKSVLCLRVNTEVLAVVNECTHLGHRLDGGRLIGDQLSCPSHGACFDLRSGRALSGPAVIALTTLATRVEQGRVLVALPAA